MFDNIKLDKNKYYFLSPFGLGDTMILSGLKKKIEDKLCGEIIFIIKPSHEIIMNMYDIKKYITLSSNKRFDSENNILIDLAKKVPYPQKGKIFVAHWLLFPQYKDVFDYQIKNRSFTFLDAYKLFFQLDWNTELEQKSWLPSITSTTRKKLPENIKLGNLAILLPEAHSVNGLPNSFWLELQDNLEKQKLEVYTAFSNKNDQICGIKNIDLSIEDLVAVSLNCHSVYTMRNGLCDLIFSKGKNLHVFYPDINTYYYFRLKTLYPRATVNELIIRGNDYGF